MSTSTCCTVCAQGATAKGQVDRRSVPPVFRGKNDPVRLVPGNHTVGNFRQQTLITLSVSRYKLRVPAVKQLGSHHLHAVFHLTEQHGAGFPCLVTDGHIHHCYRRRQDASRPQQAGQKQTCCFKHNNQNCPPKLKWKRLRCFPLPQSSLIGPNGELIRKPIP